jgi:hypothetical protein
MEGVVFHGTSEHVSAARVKVIISHDNWHKIPILKKCSELENMKIIGRGLKILHEEGWKNSLGRHHHMCLEAFWATFLALSS